MTWEIEIIKKFRTKPLAMEADYKTIVPTTIMLKKKKRKTKKT